MVPVVQLLPVDSQVCIVYGNGKQTAMGQYTAEIASTCCQSEPLQADNNPSAADG